MSKCWMLEAIVANKLFDFEIVRGEGKGGGTQHVPRGLIEASTALYGTPCKFKMSSEHAKLYRVSINYFSKNHLFLIRGFVYRNPRLFFEENWNLQVRISCTYCMLKKILTSAFTPNYCYKWNICIYIFYSPLNLCAFKLKFMFLSCVRNFGKNFYLNCAQVPSKKGAG